MAMLRQISWYFRKTFTNSKFSILGTPCRTTMSRISDVTCQIIRDYLMIILLSCSSITESLVMLIGLVFASGRKTALALLTFLLSLVLAYPGGGGGNSVLCSYVLIQSNPIICSFTCNLHHAEVLTEVSILIRHKSVAQKVTM